VYARVPDLRYLSRFNVNRGLRPPFSVRGGLGDFDPAYFRSPNVPYHTLMSAPLYLNGLEGLEGFFSSDNKHRKRYAVALRDWKVRQWMGDTFSTEDKLYMQRLQYEAEKEAAEGTGLSKVMNTVVIPAAMSLMTAGALTPLAIGMAAASAGVTAVTAHKAEKQAGKYADESFRIQQDITRTEGQVEDIQREIAEMQRQSGVPKPVINKAIEDAANQQEQQKKTLSLLALAGGALALFAAG
jgi:hypothetical protein